MTENRLCSLIVTSYNQKKTLAMLLTSLSRQTLLNFEVVIADDGSSDGSEGLVKEIWPFALKWVTQEDLGYRKAKILNQAVRQASTEYLIFLDADVVVEKHFVEDHLTLRKIDHFVCGRRTDLGPEVSKNLGISDVRQGRFDHISFEFLKSALRKDTHGLKRALRVPIALIRQILGYDRPLDILGSNVGLWKKDLEAINGFNEALESYWGEDGDLFIRLRNSKKTAIGAKGLCIQYHLFHPRRDPDPENVQKYNALLQNTDYKWATKGLSGS